MARLPRVLVGVRREIDKWFSVRQVHHTFTKTMAQRFPRATPSEQQADDRGRAAAVPHISSFGSPYDLA
jgi:hypothetical protein